MEQLIFLAICLVVFGFIGKVNEVWHYWSIKRREKKYLNLPVIAMRHPYNDSEISDSKLVYGEVAIAVDYYKSFMAMVLSVFGLELYVYETLLDRARREAILRMKALTAKMGGDAIINLKIEPLLFSKSNSPDARRSACVAVIVSGTAVELKR